MGYMLADWLAGKVPAKGWDGADAVADGWSADDITALLKAAVTDDDLPFPGFPGADDEPAGSEPDAPTDLSGGDAAPVEPPAPMPVQFVGADAIRYMPKIQGVEHNSEVFIAQQFAGSLKGLCGDVVRADGSFWAWGPTCWREISEQKLRLAVHQYDQALINGKKPISVGKSMINGILSEVGTILGQPDFFSNPTMALNAADCVIEIAKGGELTTRPHNPDDRFRFTIPARYGNGRDEVLPEGSMLRKLVHGAFLGDPDEAEKIDLIGEILGAAAFGIATRLKQPKAFVLLGESASNGKSTIASLIECLLPSDAVSHIPPSAYEDERRIVNLAGKAANVADELSAAAVAGETFKAAVTGNTIEGRDLYRSAMTFTPRAIHVFTTNTLPRFNGGLDRGLQRRLVVIRFNRSIPENEIVEDIADRIRLDELDLLLRFAIAGARRLFESGAYTIPASSKEALQGWLLLDPVNEWFETRVRAVTHEPYGGWPGTGKLFHDFKAWAIEQGHGERFLPPVNTFSQRLKALPGVTIKRRSSGTVATGIELRVVGDNAPLDDVMVAEPVGGVW